MQLKRYRHKKARFCVLTESYVPYVGGPLLLFMYFDVIKYSNNNMEIKYSAIERIRNIKEIVNLYDGLSLAVTSRCLYIFHTKADSPKFEMVAVKDVPAVNGKTKFFKPYMSQGFYWWIRSTTGFEIGSFIAEEVDSRFAKYNMYIVKSGEKYFLCTKI